MMTVPLVFIAVGEEISPVVPITVEGKNINPPNTNMVSETTFTCKPSH